jgi:hypothetical protein
MTNVLDHLESLAVSPAASGQALPAGLPAAVRAAIGAGDATALAHALGGRAFMACSIYAPERDEPGREEQPVAPDEEPDEQPGERQPDAA